MLKKYNTECQVPGNIIGANIIKPTWAIEDLHKK